jgi:preprotein translocase subunit YajC
LICRILMQAEPVASNAAETTGQVGGGGSPYSTIFLFVILFGIMYVFLIMPQKQRDKKHRAMLSELKKNDRVVTAGGVHGIIMSVKDSTAILKVDDDKDVKITVNLASIAQVVSREEQETDSK